MQKKALNFFLHLIYYGTEKCREEGLCALFDRKSPVVYTMPQGRCNERQAVSHSPERG